MTPEQLCRELTVDRQRVEQWIDEGLPWTCDNPRRKRFAWDCCAIDEAAAAAWLLARGHAQRERVATTLAQVGTHFGVSSRMVGYWKAEGMPVRADGVFDLDDITAWRAARFGDEANAPLPTGKNRATYEAELARLRAESKQLELDRLRGRLIEVDIVDRICRRQIAEIKTHLEQLPDFVLSLLPKKAGGKLQTRLRERVARRVAQLEQAMADFAQDLANELESDE